MIGSKAKLSLSTDLTSRYYLPWNLSVYLLSVMLITGLTLGCAKPQEEQQRPLHSYIPNDALFAMGIDLSAASYKEFLNSPWNQLEPLKYALPPNLGLSITRSNSLPIWNVA